MVSEKTKSLILNRTNDWFEGADDRLDLYKDTLESVFRSLNINPSTLKDVADIGAGFGASTTALSEKAPHAHIYACSIGDEPTEQVFSTLGSRLSFQESEFSDFLQSPDVPILDLVLMAAAPYHGLNEQGGAGYLKLGEKIKSGGYFLTLTDSNENIDVERLKEAGFIRLRYEDKSVLPADVWQKA